MVLVNIINKKEVLRLIKLNESKEIEEVYRRLNNLREEVDLIREDVKLLTLLNSGKEQPKHI